MDIFNVNFVQWPAASVTLLSSWLVASTSETRRRLGFWGFLGGNALWLIWGVTAQAYGLVALQICLALLNFRGVSNNDHR